MTIQRPDTLIWNDFEHLIPNGGPLLNAWPEENRPKFKSLSTACWRGFFATWIVDSAGWLRVASVRTGVTVTPIHDDIKEKPKALSKSEREQLQKHLAKQHHTTLEVAGQLIAFFERTGKAEKISISRGVTERLFDLFPGCDGPVSAIWYSGELLTCYGEEVEHPMPYVVVYPHYRIFHVDQGKVHKIDDHNAEWWYSQNPDVDRSGKRIERFRG